DRDGGERVHVHVVAQVEILADEGPTEDALGALEILRVDPEVAGVVVGAEAAHLDLRSHDADDERAFRSQLVALGVLPGHRREVLHVEGGAEQDFDVAAPVALGEQIDPGEDGQEEGHDHGRQVGEEVALHAVFSSPIPDSAAFLAIFLLSPDFFSFSGGRSASAASDAARAKAPAAGSEAGPGSRADPLPPEGVDAGGAGGGGASGVSAGVPIAAATVLRNASVERSPRL